MRILGKQRSVDRRRSPVVRGVFRALRASGSPSTDDGPRTTDRSGFTIIELIASLAVLGALLAMMVPVLRLVEVQSRSARERRAALEEAENLLDRLAQQPWEELTPANGERRLPGFSPSAMLAAALREPKVSVTIDPTESRDVPPARRITVEIGWKDFAGADVSPVRLSIWVHRQSTK